MSTQVNFITTQSLANVSGGWSGLSRNLYEQLSSRPALALHYVGPIDPPISKTAKAVSKLRRLAGGSGSFYAFSEKRLRRVGDEVGMATPEGDYDLFLGVTPWIRCRSNRPYGAYLDACFRTYFDQNLRTEEFSPRDVQRIELAEKEWLEQAAHVFWASAWSRDEAIRHYQLKTPNHHVVGIGGNLEVPEANTWAGQLNFLFIAQNFALKGGPVACAAFQTVGRQHHQAKLVILGQKPPEEFLAQPGIEYAGHLRKDRPDELARLRAILASAFCLIYPTTSDTIGQVIIECGYYGCPAIAPRRFAIPEIVHHEKTGLLIDPPSSRADFENAMRWLIENHSAYQKMRRIVRDHYLASFTFQAVAEGIAKTITLK